MDKQGVGLNCTEIDSEPKRDPFERHISVVRRGPARRGVPVQEADAAARGGLWPHRCEGAGRGRRIRRGS